MVMRVAVIMAVRNMGHSVDAAVNSILEQTYRELELLAVDDASSDSSNEALCQWKSRDSRVQVFTNPKNLGYPASLNLGWKNTDCSYIAIMDADDLAMSERIERQVDFLERNPDIAVVGSAVEFIDEQGNSLGIQARPTSHEELARRMYRESPFFHPSVMMRREFLEGLSGYDERLRRCQDCDLWLRGYQRFRFANLSDILVKYRVSPKVRWSSIGYGVFVLARAGWREGAWFKGPWYAGRFAASGTLVNLGLRPRLPS